MSTIYNPGLKKLVARAVLVGGLGLAVIGLGAGIAYADPPPPVIPGPPPPTTPFVPPSTEADKAALLETCQNAQSTGQVVSTDQMFWCQMEMNRPSPPGPVTQGIIQGIQGTLQRPNSPAN